MWMFYGSEDSLSQYFAKIHKHTHIWKYITLQITGKVEEEKTFKSDFINGNVGSEQKVEIVLWLLLKR